MFFTIPIRLIVYGLNIYVGLCLYFLSKIYHSPLSIVQWYAFLAFVNLYISLLIQPLYSAFPRLPYKPAAIKSRQALGISSFVFSLIHSYKGFFGFIGGFSGLGVWSNKYIMSVILGTIALCILTLLTVTSFHGIKKNMGQYWKKLHRFVYLAALLVLIHGVTITIHVFHLTEIFIVSYIGIVFLLYLEAVRFDKYIHTIYPWISSNCITRVVFPLCSLLLFWSFFAMNHHTH